MSYHIETTETSLYVIRDKDGNRIWSYAIEHIAHTIENGVSEVIHHLLQKNWVDAPLLYQIAVIIQQSHTDNNINWYDTFMMVERRDYLDKAYRLKKNIEKKEDASVLDRILFGQQSYNEEEMESVKHILISNLKIYKLPFAPH